jgi:hypothetical protein
MTLDPAKPSAEFQASLAWFAQNDAWRGPIGELGDKLIQAALDALRLRFPTRTPDERSLAIIGKDRRIPRAPEETAESYARRLTLWLDLWGIAGLPLGLLYAIQSFVFPGYPRVALVERSGLWHTLDANASRDVSPFEAMTIANGEDPYVPIVGASVTPRAQYWMHYGAWPDWDSVANPARAAHVEDFLLFVYPPSYDLQDGYDTGLTYDSGELWGLKTSKGNVDTLRELVRIYSRAGSHCVSAVFPETLDLYAPNMPPDADWPDGTWAKESKDDGAGNSMPSRSPKNSYLLDFG